MSETRSNDDASAQARDALAKAEAGDADAIAELKDAREAVPSDVEAVEQEASEGPAERGLAR